MIFSMLHLFACYLLSIFGDFIEGHSSDGHSMAGNAEVMDLWGGLLLESWWQQIQGCRVSL